MQWIAPSEKDSASTTLEKRLWDAADQFRANSGLKPQEYSGPILGLIFLRFAEARFTVQHTKLAAAGSKGILLNLGEVNYIDSSGIGELVSAFTTISNQGGTLKLLNLTKRVKDLLQITKLYTVFEVFDDEAKAIASY